MAHSAVWGHSPIQKQNTNSNKLIIEKLSKSGLQGVQNFVKLIELNNERKNETFIDFAFNINQIQTKPTLQLYWEKMINEGQGGGGDFRLEANLYDS